MNNREIVAALKGQIRKLTAAVEALEGEAPADGVPEKRSKMSPAARRKIGAATRARWARYRAAKERKAKAAK